jgi:hypothetical protein
MKTKLTLALLALCAAPAAFAATPPATGYQLGTTDAIILGAVSALLIAALVFRAQVKKYARLKLNK